MFEDESGVSLLPAVRATWAPRGQTPVLRHRFNWKRLSMAGALAYEPDGTEAQLVFQIRPGAYNDETLIEFLTAMHQLLDGRKVLLVWDGLPSHRRHRDAGLDRPAAVLAGGGAAGRLCAGAEPGRGLWSSLRAVELANLATPTLGEVIDQAHRGIDRVRRTPQPAYSFLRRTGLSVS